MALMRMICICWVNFCSEANGYRLKEGAHHSLRMVELIQLAQAETN